MYGLDGYWSAYYGGWGPIGYMQFAGFDKMEDGESMTIKLTMHKPIPWQIGYSITSELVEDTRPFVLEP